MDSKSCQTTRESSPSTNQAALQLCLRMGNVYRRFVSILAGVAAPLSVRMNKNQPCEFKPSFVKLDELQELKDRLVSRLRLAPSRDGRWYHLDMDACDHQIGCAIMQQEPNGDKPPVVYRRRSLSAPRKSYCGTE